MNFTMFCVGIVITVVVGVISLVIGFLFGYGDDDARCELTWIISTIGFGICLTILLYQNGVI